jgi:DNA-binding response OmpR family regulator
MRILIVEDEKKVVRFLSLGLKAERFLVDPATDGETGFEIALGTLYA